MTIVLKNQGHGVTYPTITNYNHQAAKINRNLQLRELHFKLKKKKKIISSIQKIVNHNAKYQEKQEI